MHEQIIAQQILKQVEIVEKEKKKKVKSITVEVGDVAHLPLEEMEATLKAMVKYKVIMLAKKAKVQCGCGFVGEPKIIHKGHDSTLFECPKCSLPMPKILDGHDIILKEVTV
ncbi:hypothetical protein C4573_00380 [Candidatus Woesearchaeota archaeon]|nr:MAG: hypothetical protein C4573_00380 [Candidatus Woesearchaeota archaeon]